VEKKTQNEETRLALWEFSFIVFTMSRTMMKDKATIRNEFRALYQGVWTYSKEHDLFLIHVFDLKGMQVALAQGGGASLVALFCTVCDCTKDVRATLLEGETPVDPAEIRTRVQHLQRESDIPELEEALKSYKPERHQTNASPGADALPGVTPENVALCLLHCENRMTMQTVQKTWGDFERLGMLRSEKENLMLYKIIAFPLELFL